MTVSDLPQLCAAVGMRMASSPNLGDAALNVRRTGFTGNCD